MKKLFLLIALLVVLVLPFTILAVGSGEAGQSGGNQGGLNGQTTTGGSLDQPGNNGGTGGIVTCNGPDCTIDSFFAMLGKIYNFIVLDIATPLAVIAIIVGAIFMMISAGNPSLMETGKKIFYAAVIGLVLVFCSWLIINFILTTLGGHPLGG